MHILGLRDGLPGRGGDPPGHRGASLGPLDGLRRYRRSDVVGFVLGLRLERQEPAEIALDLGAVGASLTEQGEHLVVLFACGSLAEPSAADGVGRVDPGMNGEARGGDVATGLWYMTARHWKATDMGGSVYNQYGWYNADFIRENGDWKMSFIKHDFRWVDGNNALFDMTEPQLVDCMQRVFSPDNIAAAAKV